MGWSLAADLNGDCRSTKPGCYHCTSKAWSLRPESDGHPRITKAGYCLCTTQACAPPDLSAMDVKQGAGHVKGGQIRPMSGAMVAVAAGWGRSGRRISLIVKTKPPCGVVNFVPDHARGLREKALGYCSAMAFGGELGI